MRPASTVGTNVSLLPSPTPNSSSFPELSRLGAGRKRVSRIDNTGTRKRRPRRGGRCGQEGEETGVFPTPSFPGFQILCPESVWGRLLGPGSPLSRSSNLLSHKPNSRFGHPLLHFNRALSAHLDPCVPFGFLPRAPSPAPVCNPPTPALACLCGRLRASAHREAFGGLRRAGLPLLPPWRRRPPPPLKQRRPSPSRPSPTRAPPLGMDTECPWRPTGGGLPGQEAI